MSTADDAELTELENPRIVDLFAGPGGFDVAAHWLGVPSIGVEFDANACATRNAAGLQTRFEDVTKVHPEEYLDCNVLVGGPPCQTFTVAGRGAGRRALDDVLQLVGMLAAGKIDEALAAAAKFSDPRTGLVLQPLIWALIRHRIGKPYEAIVLEQVPAVEPVWHAMAAVLRGIGYGASAEVLKSEQFGVPQTRRRAVLIARRGFPSSAVRFPEPTHEAFDRRREAGGEDFLSIFRKLQPCVSMREALQFDLQYRMPFTVVSNYGSGGDPRNRGRRTSDQPSFTITGKASRNKIVFDNGVETRFTQLVSSCLQSFPHDYQWEGGDISQQIGNAVPPRMAAHVLNAVLGRPSWAVDDVFFREVQKSWFSRKPTGMVPVGVEA
ncbi:DNA cytosine methyltransferase [Tomitella fengzijianii]|uniref:DNA (cytosine-5-)-methyltransferase n=1 Tax=Tomitella fengzijianii TaxID=2597660 RepID=A0A516WZZ0_9ACTN|nr:DNA cytosine methyltransferase [Tomitella fengzijianii]QDQ96340.1 DNA cytosine methyltransferase [Tomitella fengzijianii]